MVESKDPAEGGLMVRVAVLEAKVRLLSLALKGTVAVLVGSLVTYFLRG